MTKTQRASEQITDAVTSWAGVSAASGERGEFSFKLGRREIGHLHGDRVLHAGFPKAVWHVLYAAGRIDYRGPASPIRRMDRDDPIVADRPGNHGPGAGGNVVLRSGSVKTVPETDPAWGRAAATTTP